MNELSLVVNKQEWLDAPQAAHIFGVSLKQMRKLLNKYITYIDNKYIKREISKGRTGFKTFITKEGLVILANLKDGSRNKTNNASDASLQGKKKIAEIAVDKSKLSPTQALLQVVQQMVDMERGMNERMDKIEQLALETPKVEMVTSQREYLNDRLRNYCAQTEVSHSFVWKKLHRYIGKDSINDYRFDDYKPAIRYLKQMYEESRLKWN